MALPVKSGVIEAFAATAGAGDGLTNEIDEPTQFALRAVKCHSDVGAAGAQDVVRLRRIQPLTRTPVGSCTSARVDRVAGSIITGLASRRANFFNPFVFCVSGFSQNGCFLTGRPDGVRRVRIFSACTTI